MDEPLNHGAPLPPRGQLRWHKIVSPTKGRSLRAIILGRTFTARWTHYGPPTLPCAENEDCHLCRKGYGSRYNGYIDSLIGSPGQLSVLAITFKAACQFTDLLIQHGTLRGLEVTLSRLFKSDRAPMVVTLERVVPADQLPPSFDILDSLARQWGINREYLARGCRRIGEDEAVQKMIREEMQKKAEAGKLRPFKPPESA